MTQILEGTWEEIKSHDSELAGRTVRVIVDPEASNDSEIISMPPYTIHTQAQLEEILRVSLQGPPSEPMTRTDWNEIARKGQLLALQRIGETGSDA